MERLALALPACASSAKRLRNELQRWLLDAGINGSTGHDITTAASEAFANAIKHPLDRKSNTIRVLAVITSDAITINVSDDGHWRHYPDPNPDHYGQHLMNQLMDSTHLDRSASGTTISLHKRL